MSGYREEGEEGGQKIHIRGAGEEGGTEGGEEGEGEGGEYFLGFPPGLRGAGVGDHRGD